MLDKAETNGYLRAVEAQLRAIEAQMLQLHYTADLTPEAERVFREVRVDFTNLTGRLFEVRGWNG